MTSKQLLRQQMRLTQRQHAGEPAEGLADGQAALQQIRRWTEARTVLLYSALPDEVPTRQWLDRLLAEGRQVLLPRVVSDTEMTLHRYTGAADLQPGAFHIMEPSGEPFADYVSIDAAVIPGMAFDAEGHRLGRGRGYYDRFLERVPRMLRIGLCYEWQLVPHVPTATHDVRMHYVLTVTQSACRLYACQSYAGNS